MVIGLCDDDRLWLNQASEILAEYFAERNESLEILCFEDADQLLAYQGASISVLFMDIELEDVSLANLSEKHQDTCRVDFPGMIQNNFRTDFSELIPDNHQTDFLKEDQVKRQKDNDFTGNGIELASRINRLWPDCCIVYCTNYLSYALDAYETKHIYFIIKSQFQSRLPAIFDKISAASEYDKKEIYFHVIGQGLTCFPIKEICYFERVSRHTELHMEHGCVSIREKISNICDIVPQDIFTRCHTSFLVNMGQIAQKNKNLYILKTGDRIPVSRSYARQTREDFLAWCEREIP